MTLETLLVTILAVLPGYVGLLVFRFLSADAEGTTWETIARSLVIGLVSVAPVLTATSFGYLQGYWDYVFGPRELTVDVLWGVLFHTASAIVLSAGLAKVLTSEVVQRLGRSVFHSGWDWIWFRTSKSSPYLGVETANGTFYGLLAFAGTWRKGGGLVIRNPMILTDQGRLLATGAEYLLLNESEIRYVQVTSFGTVVQPTKPEGGVNR